MMRYLPFGSTSKEASDVSPQSFSSPASQRPNVTGPPRPIRFVYCDEKGKFRMDPEAVATLQLVKEPVGVVAVCGRARQGKSYVLNQLLGRSSGFQVAATHRPCTKGLWLWSAPIRRTALDGTEYNLLLLDSEGIDAFDQTGTYSTQIFSLAVLLSSMFIYNQMGGIDEVALDRLSLVTQMTKHIRVRASGVKSSANELGQFSPIFVWLLRDFYLDLVEDDRRITPREYLELALQSVVAGGRDVSAKNEIRDSIRALFPDRECFPLVRPLNDETDLQRLDQISLNKLRPEFRSGLDALTKFVFERTRPKQVGATVMTGPILIRVTESYLEALNNGAVPTIVSSWQSVEESECRKAYDSATEVYMSSFDRSKPPEEAALREAHDAAVQKSVSFFNANAVGAGSARQKYDKLLHTFFRKAFEDYKRNVYMEADIKCSDSIHSMGKKLREACHTPEAKVPEVIKVLIDLVYDYESSSHGPGKWQKLTKFLEQSLEGPVLDIIKKRMEQIGSERSSLMLKCRSIEDRMGLLQKQLEVSETHKSEYMKRYEDSINDKKKLADDYMSRITNLQSNCSSMEERGHALLKTLESTKQENSDWKRRYEQALSKQRADEEQANSEIAALKSRSSTAEARLEAAREQSRSAQEDANEWKRKYEFTARESKIALEKAAIVQERTNKQMQQREDALREEFVGALADKEDEIKQKNAKIEHAEQRLTTLNLELKAAESKIKSYDLEISSLNFKIEELSDKLESVNARAQSYEREARMLEQDKAHLEEKYRSEFHRFDEVQERCRVAEKEAKRATELADRVRAEAVSAQKEKSEIQQLAMERLTLFERAQRQIEIMERQWADLVNEAEGLRVSEKEALSKVRSLEARVGEREEEIEGLLKSNNEQRASTVHVLEGLLETERRARGEANMRAEALSLQLQTTQGKLDSLQQELTSARLNETALDSKLKSSQGKRGRVDDYEMETDERGRSGNKKSKNMSPLGYRDSEDGGLASRENEDTQSVSEDYMKFTVQKLRQELTKHNFGAELLQLRNPNKKDIVALYEKCVLQRS